MPFVLVITHFHQILPIVASKAASSSSMAVGSSSALGDPVPNALLHCTFETTRDAADNLVFLYRLREAGGGISNSSEALWTAVRSGIEQSVVERAAEVLAAISGASGE